MDSSNYRSYIVEISIVGHCPKSRTRSTHEDPDKARPDSNSQKPRERRSPPAKENEIKETKNTSNVKQANKIQAKEYKVALPLTETGVSI